MTTHRRDAVTSTAEKTGERTRRVVVSDESVDRYNTTFAADGWETRNFEKNPILLWCHQAGEEPIGKATVSRRGRELIADCEFFTAELNARAVRVLGMIDAGVLAVSHRFEPLEYKYNLDRESSGDGWYPPIDYLRQELLEISIVCVGGNANAVPIRNFTDPEDLRLLAEAATVRSFDPPRIEVKKLREAAVAARSAAQPEPAPVPVPAPPAPEQEKPIDEQELEVEGLDAAGVSSLVQETVKEVMSQRSRSLELHRRGELEVA